MCLAKARRADRQKPGRAGYRSRVRLRAPEEPSMLQEGWARSKLGQAAPARNRRLSAAGYVTSQGPEGRPPNFSPAREGWVSIPKMI
jgi:hypothetical protein